MAFNFLQMKLGLQNYSYAASLIRHTQPCRFYCKSVILVSLFKSYGFTANQISSLADNIPVALSRIRPEKTLKPKLDFFKSVGLSPSDLHKILSVGTRCLRASLNERIIPSYQHLQSILQTNEDVNFSIKRAPQLLWLKWQIKLSQNMDRLRESGVPDDRILYLLKTQPRAMIVQTDRFMEIVSKVKKMEFVPGGSHFVTAVRVLAGISDSSWEKKMEIYRKWGWSDEDIVAAFKHSPACMGASNKKIDMVMHFLVDKMGFSPSEIGECPYCVTYSLQKWTGPRCLVYQFLLSKGLVDKKRLAYLISVNRQVFSKVFLNPYVDRFPELLTIYQPMSAGSLDLAAS